MKRRTVVRRATPARCRSDLIERIGNIVHFNAYGARLKGLISDVTRDGRLLIIEVAQRDGMWQAGRDAFHYLVDPEDVIQVIAPER